jgi:hypothetical protein
MTISSTTVKNSYSGNGSTTAFAYTFKIFANTDLQVIIRSSTGTETVKTLTTHYTVSGVGDASGGNVTFTSGNIPASGETVVIRRAVPQTQAIDYIANDPFPAESHEEGLDRATMTTQQVQEELDRAIKLSRTNTMTSTEFSVGASDRANKILAFDGSGEISVTQELGTFVGNWSASRDYNARDIVKDTSTNNIFICNTAHTSSGSQPLTTNTDSAKWDLLVDAASATTSATNAATSATAAASSATAAASSATTASTQASNASTSASNAASSATAAAASATDAANSADAFDDVYLGSKSSDPTTDNDGDALAAGMLYYNTSSNIMRVYSGSAWENVAVSTTGFATLTGVETLTNKTLTSPKIGTKISDTNGNELLNLTATSSAVNELTLANAATGNKPTITASGGDTNIGVSIQPKGSGQVTIDNLTFPAADGSADQFLKTDGSGNLSFSAVSGGTDWQSAEKTANFTAVAGEGYFVNTTGGAFEIDLPTSPSVGDTIEFVDSRRNFATANLTLDQGSNKFQGNTSPKPVYDVDGQSIRIVYSGSTQGWIPTSDDDVTMETPQTYTVDFLVIAGGGAGGFDRGGGGGAGGYRNSYSTESSGGGGSSETSLSLSPGTAYTITVGAGGSAPTSPGLPDSGNNSSISGSDITTITSTGGGGAGGNAPTPNRGIASDGGSGGGKAYSGTAGSGTANQGFDGGSTSNGEAPAYQMSGGGGAGEAGDTDGVGHGGDGLSSSITGSAVSRGGGGGGFQQSPAGADPGGTGGGGDSSSSPSGNNQQNGTANTGGGGGGGDGGSPGNGSSGGSGVVILRMPTANYSGTTTGSPTVTTDGSDTIITFTGSGSYTG